MKVMMRSFEDLKGIKGRVGGAVALLLLISVGMLAHSIAMGHVNLLGDLSANMQPRAAGRLRFVEYMNSHPFMMLPYFSVFAGGVFWIQFRKLPGRSLWLTIALMALPILGYIWICFRISTAVTF